MAEKEKKSTKALLVNTKVALAKAEKELIAAKKNKKKTDETTMKVITGNYEVAKNNLAIAKQLEGTAEPASSKRQHVARQSSATQMNKSTSSSGVSSLAKSASSSRKSSTAQASSSSASSQTASQALKAITMTRHQYREKIRHHHKS